METPQSKAPTMKHISTTVSMRTYRFLMERKMNSSFILQEIIRQELDKAAEEYFAGKKEVEMKLP